jgi:hypothetical protein
MATLRGEGSALGFGEGWHHKKVDFYSPTLVFLSFT